MKEKFMILGKEEMVEIRKGSGTSSVKNEDEEEELKKFISPEKKKSTKRF